MQTVQTRVWGRIWTGTTQVPIFVSCPIRKIPLFVFCSIQNCHFPIIFIHAVCKALRNGIKSPDVICWFNFRCSMIVHIEYRCPECEKVFNCPANLASHRRWHKPKQAHTNAFHMDNTRLPLSSSTPTRAGINNNTGEEFKWSELCICEGVTWILDIPQQPKITINTKLLLSCIDEIRYFFQWIIVVSVRRPSRPQPPSGNTCCRDTSQTMVWAT